MKKRRYYEERLAQDPHFDTKSTFLKMITQLQGKMEAPEAIRTRYGILDKKSGKPWVTLAQVVQEHQAARAKETMGSKLTRSLAKTLVEKVKK